MSYVIRFKQDPESVWLTNNPILAKGEPGYEEESGQFKIGDGVNQWADLEYFTAGAINLQMLVDHINAENPHPVYDDGPSLSLLYENAKV